jgi:hypothetical protein
MSRIFDNTFLNFSTSPRSARSSKYLLVSSADIFSAKAELMN